MDREPTNIDSFESDRREAERAAAENRRGKRGYQRTVPPPPQISETGKKSLADWLLGRKPNPTDAAPIQAAIERARERRNAKQDK